MACDKCKKDWTKCATCPVMMKWVRENRQVQRKGGIKNG